ncbi:MAG: trehalose-phosphatase [Rubritepida sp.]|nr:trehalose-phosphatase [Rubritepida sp.]
METLPQRPRAVPSPREVLSRCALLLDVDGTLVEIAPRPDDVFVPDTLRSDLGALYEAMGGAVALITGRGLADVEGLIAPLRLPIAAEHGGVLRPDPSEPPQRALLLPAPQEWRDAAAAYVAAHRGMVFEEKSGGFVLHYRLAPEQDLPAFDLLRTLIGTAKEFEILRAAMAWEVRPRGVNKGGAVRKIMSEAPFAGRKPIFIGDDVTDEDGIVAARELGGEGYRVPEDFQSPAAVRGWLASLVVGQHAATA